MGRNYNGFEKEGVRIMPLAPFCENKEKFALVSYGMKPPKNLKITHADQGTKQSGQKMSHGGK